MTDRTANNSRRKDSRTNKFLVSLILAILLSLVSWSLSRAEQKETTVAG
jgi:cytochrome oxidase assembly protein ShyY1